MEADWSRFHLYAARIQVLSIKSIPTIAALRGYELVVPTLHSLPGVSISDILQEHIPSSSNLLPNLRTLNWHIQDPTKTPYLPLLFSTGLVACHVTAGDDIDEILNILADKCADSDRYSDDNGSILINEPNSFDPHLQNYHVMAHLLPRLACLPALEDLRWAPGRGHLSLEDFRWAPSSGQRAEYMERGFDTCFPNLHSIWLMVALRDLDHVATFLSSIQTTALRRFTLIAPGESHPDASPMLERLTEALSGHRGLQAFSITLTIETPVVLQNSPHIDSLVRLTELEAVSFDGNFSIADECLHRLSYAWPRLQELTIISLSPNVAPQASPTLGVLECFAAHNPRLTNLHIMLDARRVPTRHHDNLPERLDPIYIHFDWSPISVGSSIQFAEYISNIYPCAELRINSYRPPNYGYPRTKVWQEVDKMIPITSSVNFGGVVAEVCDRLGGF